MDPVLARRVAASVPDPELPELTIEELGILRDVTLHDGRVEVTITPTYLGCPALAAIEADVRERLGRAGFADVTVHIAVTEVWTTAAITEAGRRKLAAAGIAPPRSLPLTVLPRGSVPCPRCGAADTVRTAAFGATLCRSLHRCRACDEPFEHVKEVG